MLVFWTDFSKEYVIKVRACCRMTWRLLKCRPANFSCWECALRLIAHICIKRSIKTRKFVWTFCAVFVKKLNRFGMIRFQIDNFNVYPSQKLKTFLNSVFLFVCLFIGISIMNVDFSVQNVMNSCVRSSRRKEAAI